ncbi:MAG: PKD domain-containing protein, partial [Thermoplasmata archaeon]
VTVAVTDGREGHEVLAQCIVNITSNNLPPSLVIGIAFAYGPNMTHALPDEVMNFLVVISDPEHDPIELVWDFGDYSPRVYLNLTVYDENGTVMSSVSHSYAATGEYTITVWFTDNKVGLLNHSKVITAIVKVDVERVVVPKRWDWWDYTSLGLVWMIPVLVVILYGNGRRKMKRLSAEGLTIEEERIRRERMLMERLLESERKR